MSEFEPHMREYLPKFKSALKIDIGEWVVKGFIDTNQTYVRHGTGHRF